MRADYSIVWLVVENDDDDFLLVARALHRVAPYLRLHRAKDGFEAKAFLMGEGVYANRDAFPLPSLILSDLNMPTFDGLKLLAWVKNQSALGWIPFILLTSSTSGQDLHQARASGVNDYLVKPILYSDLLVLLQNLTSRFCPPPE